MSSMAGAMIDVGAVQRGRALARRLLIALWLTGLSLFVLLAGLLLLRRLGGALVRPLGGWSLVGMAFVAVAMAAGLRWPGWATTRQLSAYSLLSTQYSVLGTRYSISALLTAAAFLLPGLASLLLMAALPCQSIGGLVFAWLLVVGSESGSWFACYGLSRGQAAIDAQLPAEEIESTEAEIPVGLVQQITRVREADHESIHVLAQAEISAGDRLGVLHVAFCPPLEGEPELNAHAVEAIDAEVRITQAETFGARVEVRCAAVASSARSVVVEVIGKVACGKAFPAREED